VDELDDDDDALPTVDVLDDAGCVEDAPPPPPAPELDVDAGWLAVGVEPVATVVSDVVIPPPT
jgi:hypothetical protein